MSYQIRIRRAAQKELDALHRRDYTDVAKSISALGQEPRPPRVKKLAETGLWRIRVGHYRVVYAIDDARQLVTVVRIARRKEDTYKKL